MMYLKHFGLSEPPFKITPVTSFFFSGANRGEILDALIYAITGSEGIIKITGEVGSGKTMLCRMLLERLPTHVEPVYLANPSLSREEMLYAIADALNLDMEGQRVNVILQNIQNLLEQKLADGKRVVVLVDEAHAMPLDTLEELRLIYNMQVGDQKLLQIVLFGQPELNEKLDQPNMRQLKDRIVHHFTMLPLSKNAIEAYLMFRMRAAGFRGSNIFSAKALALIGNASQGLLRRINILADKSLLAAFVEDAQTIETHHVEQAIRDSDFAPARHKRRIALAALVALILILALLGLFWSPASSFMFSRADTAVAPATPIQVARTSAQADPAPAPAPSTAIAPASTVAAIPGYASAVAASAPAAEAPATAVQPRVAKGSSTAAQSGKKAERGVLLQKRIDATKALLAGPHRNDISIQLFYTTRLDTRRMEHFLQQARKLGKLHLIYIALIKNGQGARVLYGTYPNIDAANKGMRRLPRGYTKAYAPTLYQLASAQH